MTCPCKKVREKLPKPVAVPLARLHRAMKRKRRQSDARRP